MQHESQTPMAVVERPRDGRGAADVRRGRGGVAVSLAVHAAAAGLAFAFAPALNLRIDAFGNARSSAIVATFAERTVPDDAAEQGGPQRIVITPTEAWQDDRRYVNTTVRTTADRAAGVPSPATGRPSLDRTVEVRPTDAARPQVARRSVSVPRRRAAASVEPSIARVALPPPDIRFVGRPCRYPAVAVEAGWEGNVVLLIAIDADGAVTHVEIAESSGNGAVDAEAVQTARGWRAVPNKPGGKLWAGKVLKPIHFRLR